MKIFIQVKGELVLPTLEDLISQMWKKSVSTSKFCDAGNFAESTDVSLCWDKWIDDKRWKGHKKFKEYIEFSFPRNTSEDKIVVEVEDDALLVDKRAALKGAMYLSKLNDGFIRLEHASWMSPKQFHEHVRECIDLSFEDAAAQSFRG
ncbi:hypothetical protein [Paludifilum halophilum]|uniref:Uncharacterized protein n=1 Tax=Paludifilum halophilum TaxID=1642702 RepID=A0A235B3B2_9BACL|nr:hypothetical protein [Paludifilum halophilum]OYD06722.1 hypothetical protein CHM34_14180 [Paludifilum halophilum]